MAVASLYRRVLPSPPAIEFASNAGKRLFSEALQSGTMEGFFKLISYYQTQSELTYCGKPVYLLCSMLFPLIPEESGKNIVKAKTWVLLKLDPLGSPDTAVEYFFGQIFIARPWRWFDESMLDYCEPLEKVKAKGLSFKKVACLAHCAGAKVEAYRANQSSLNDFRKHVIRCTTSDDCHVIASYDRRSLKQTGAGHYSPIGGYHGGKDMALILDVARFKYPPHWVPLPHLWEAMKTTINDATGLPRGFLLLSRLPKAPSLLYTLRCSHESWVKVVNYLRVDVPMLLRSETVNSIQALLSVLFRSLPSSAGHLIKWVVEVKRQEEGSSSLSPEERESLVMEEEVLRQIRCTKLFKLVKDLLSDQLLVQKISCFKETVVISGKNEQGVDQLVPASGTTGWSGSHLGNCILKYPETSDILTILLLALPPSTWSGLSDRKVLDEMQDLVSTESMPELLQWEILHLRKQMLCVSDEITK